MKKVKKAAKKPVAKAKRKSVTGTWIHVEEEIIIVGGGFVVIFMIVMFLV